MSATKDEAREDRIIMEILVDAYGPEERATGWYCYLENTLTFGFTAHCIRTRSIASLECDDEFLDRNAQSASVSRQRPLAHLLQTTALSGAGPARFRIFLRDSVTGDCRPARGAKGNLQGGVCMLGSNLP
jgi:Calcium binding